jgi:hypothetical protein
MVWFSEWIQLSIFLFFLFFLLFFLCCCQLQRVSEWLLINANSAIFQLYYGENNISSMRWWWGPLCTRPICLVGLS